MAVLLHTFQKHLLPMRVSVVVSPDTYEKTLTTSVVTVFACFIHFTSFLDKKLQRNINMYEIDVSFFKKSPFIYYPYNGSSYSRNTWLSVQRDALKEMS